MFLRGFLHFWRIMQKDCDDKEKVWSMRWLEANLFAPEHHRHLTCKTSRISSIDKCILMYWWTTFTIQDQLPVCIVKYFKRWGAFLRLHSCMKAAQRHSLGVSCGHYTEKLSPLNTQAMLPDKFMPKVGQTFSAAQKIKDFKKKHGNIATQLFEWEI